MKGSFMNKYLLGFGGIIILGLGTYVGLSNKELAKYSIEWIKNLTVKEWESEKEIIRQNFCNPEYKEYVRLGFQNLLKFFYKVKSERDWAGITPQGPAYHREHGYNLYKP